MDGTRLVVSGQDARGKSVIVSDERIAPVDMAVAVTPLWSADAPPVLPSDGAREAVATLFPPKGGYRFLIMTLPPEGQGDHSPAELPEAEKRRMGAGASAYMEADAPGMHMTDTVDFEVVLSGEASQEFDDGAVVHLQAGDCFVQNGTRHRWFNRGSVPAVVAVVLIGADRDHGR